MTALVGCYGEGVLARVDDRGAVVLPGAGPLEWWIGADDRWVRPGAEVRQHAIGSVPVIETATRVPGGDAIARVFGAEGHLVLEIENASPAPFVAAWAGPRAATARIRTPRAVQLRPSAGTLDALWRQVTAGEARTRTARADEPVDAIIVPVAHRTTWRVAIPLVAGRADVDPAQLPDATAVARSWHAQLARGMRVRTDDRRFEERVMQARAELLLRAGSDEPVGAAEFVALEAWGFDREALDVWERLRGRERRAARRAAATIAEDPWTGYESATTAAALLDAARQVLAHVSGDCIDVLPRLPPAWLGCSVSVDDVPLGAGVAAFAVRWHGARPALLWEVPHGTEIRASALDPSFTSHEPAGEDLLAAPPADLLALRTGNGPQPVPGSEPTRAPGSFS